MPEGTPAVPLFSNTNGLVWWVIGHLMQNVRLPRQLFWAALFEDVRVLPTPEISSVNCCNLDPDFFSC